MTLTRRVRFSLVVVVVACAAVLSVDWKSWRLSVAYQHRDHGDFDFHIKIRDWIPGPEYFVPDQVCRFCNEESHDRCFAESESSSDNVYDREWIAMIAPAGWVHLIHQGGRTDRRVDSLLVVVPPSSSKSVSLRRIPMGSWLCTCTHESHPAPPR